jgi:hypothetical protein
MGLLGDASAYLQETVQRRLLSAEGNAQGELQGLAAVISVQVQSQEGLPDAWSGASIAGTPMPACSCTLACALWVGVLSHRLLDGALWQLDPCPLDVAFV